MRTAARPLTGGRLLAEGPILASVAAENERRPQRRVAARGAESRWRKWGHVLLGGAQLGLRRRLLQLLRPPPHPLGFPQQHQLRSAMRGMMSRGFQEAAFWMQLTRRANRRTAGPERPWRP